MGVIPLSFSDLVLAGGILLILGVISIRYGLSLHKPLLVATCRATLQLMFIGLVLQWLFSEAAAGWMVLVTAIMLAAAGREVLVRQTHRFRGSFGYFSAVASMFVSSFLLAILTLNLIVQPDPWYTPQYAIPLLGMLLGNTMNGIALAQERLLETAWQRRAEIEQRLMLGEDWRTAVHSHLQVSMRSGMIPAINGMATAGIVALPGMMTGQILAGSPPMVAVQYQLMILFLITAGTGLGVWVSLMLASRRLFDERQRLRLDRLTESQ